MAVIYEVGERISNHAFNSDGNMLAVSMCNDTVSILRKGTKDDWTVVQNLEEHTERVTGIDWAVKSNRVLTCSADRNAFVWDAHEQVWSPQLVVLRINRAATCCKWSPSETKFAVGTGSKLLAICQYSATEKWWYSGLIRKNILSTILCVAWHPSNMLVACGGCDMKVRIYCAYVKEDGEVKQTTWKDASEKDCSKFGSLIAEFANESKTHKGGWINSVAFSPDGSKLCWTSHDASIRVVDSLANQKTIIELTPFLPFSSVIWSAPGQLILAGYNYFPVVYEYDAEKSTLTLCGKLHHIEKTESKKGGAMSMFQLADSKGEAGIKHGVVSVHRNVITELRHFQGNACATQFSSAGHDGRIVIWKLEELKIEAL